MITKKDIFLNKLAGKPIRIMKKETTPEEVEILINAGIIKLDGEYHGNNVAIALYPVINCGITRVSGRPIEYREVRVEPGRYLHY